MNKIIIAFFTLVIIVSCKSNDLNKKDTSTQNLAEQKLLQTQSEDVINWLEENKKTEDFELTEGNLNALGYNLLYTSNKPQDAVKVFEIIIDLFPNSSNAYDSAGEAYLVTQDYNKSIKHYRKAMDLNGSIQFHQLGYVRSAQYNPTIIPVDTTMLFERVGNWENEIAFVYVQGGPDLQLNISPRDGLHLMPNHDNLLKIYPYQAQMLNQESIAANPILTENQCAYENKQSAEILNRVIKHLVDQGKKVFLIGHSYGASICMEYIHAKENLAEKAVIMGLDFDEDISSWESLKSGEYIRWENGKKPYALTVFQEIPQDNPAKQSFDRVADNLAMIVGYNMSKKYTNLIADEDFSKIISVYASEDEANGKKTEAEIGILNEKGAIIVEVEGDHHDMLTSEFMSDIYEHLINGATLAEKY